MPVTISTCCGCGSVLADTSGQAHPYVASSPACWAAYGELLSRSYEDAERRRVHQMLVDAYAVQHPGVPGRRSAQSVGLHLMTLCLFLERDIDPREGPRLHQQMIEANVFSWLTPPPSRGSITVLDVLATTGAAGHVTATRMWARSAWDAWCAHHETVRHWLDDRA